MIDCRPVVPPPPALPRSVRFHPFELDTVTGELTKHGTRLRLQEQPFRILLALLEASGDIVTRDHLVSRLWPDGTYVDFERGLNAAVNRLRQVLGDAAESPRFIETVARRGYRFAADVHAVETNPPPRSDQEEEIARPAQTRRARLGIGAVTAGVLLAAALLLIGRSTESTAPESTAMRVSPLTTYPGSEIDPSLSPDGKEIAFAWNSAKRDIFHIYRQAVGGTSARRLTTGSAEEISPAWSPDGTSIAFVRRTGSARAEIVVAPAAGGAERRLAALDFALPEGWFGALLDWHPTGEWIAASASRPGQSSLGLVLISTRDGSVRHITAPAEPAADIGPAFDPDGRYLAFVRLAALGSGVLHGVPLTVDMHPAGEAVLLHSGSHPVIADPAWIPGGRDLLVLNGPSFVPDGHIARLRPGTRTAEPVPFATVRQFSALRSTPRQNTFRFAFARETADENIWRFSLNAGHAAGMDFRPVVESTWGDNDAHISPDGQRIVFRSARSGSWEIWVSRMDGSNPTRVTEFAGAQVGAARWSPDGRRIALHARPGGQGEVYVVSPDGGAPANITNHPAQDSVATWSNDSRSIYFSSNRGGLYRLLRMPAEGGEPVEVSADGGSAASESLDGKWLYFVRTRPEGWTLVRKPARGAGSEEILAPLINIRAYQLVDDGVYYIPPSSRGEGSSVHFLGTRGERHEVARLPKPAGYGLSVYPKARAAARTILYTQKDRSESDLFLAEGFR